MKKIILIFVIAALVLISVLFWLFNSRTAGNFPEIITVIIVLVLVGFALYTGAERIKSRIRKEPAEDELSKKIMTKATSLSYLISIYLWLFIMYFSDKTTLPAHSLIGAGILGMAVVFLFCWLGTKYFGIKND
jgi:peptidoglycan/LPS O-acetylase OafA/YrhL